MKKPVRLAWEFSNKRECEQTFLTEAEALAFMERTVEPDPNVLSWELIEEV